MRAFFLLWLVMSATVADEAVDVEKSTMLEEKDEEARTEEMVVESQAGQEGNGDGLELGSRAGTVDVGDRTIVPVVAPIYPYPYSMYYWPQAARAAAPSQLARSGAKAGVPAVSYYPYTYTYPYYTYPYAPVVAAPPAPVHASAPTGRASMYYGHWQ